VARSERASWVVSTGASTWFTGALLVLLGEVLQ
jgi:hypothetical protein